MKILFYGNCQQEALMKVLHVTNSDIICTYIPCHLTEQNEEEFCETIIQQDMIVTQPINTLYRDKTYLSTSFVIQNAKSSTKVIVFPSLYFNFYQTDLIYYQVEGKNLSVPIDYHHAHILQYFSSSKSFDTFLSDVVHNENLYTNEYYDKLSNTQLEELEHRENKFKSVNEKDNLYFISVVDFIKQNYKEKLLFYSMNHPTKYMLHFLAETVLRFVNMESISIDYDIDPLDNIIPILYRSLQKFVNFDLQEISPRIETYSGKQLNGVKEIFDEYVINYKISLTLYDVENGRLD
jgi:hypothetical protein